LDKQVSSRLIENGLSALVVSIDSAHSQIHDSLRGDGSYNKAVRGIETFTKECEKEKYNDIPLISIATTITPRNITKRKDLEHLFRLASDLGVDRLRFLFVASIGRGRNFTSDQTGKEQVQHAEWIGELMCEFPELNVTLIGKHLLLHYIGEKYKAPNFDKGLYSCSGGIKFIYLNANLELYPCYILCDDDFQFGRIQQYIKYDPLNQNLLEFNDINSNRYFSQFEEIRQHLFRNLPKPCSDCRYKNECNSICSMQMLSRSIEENINGNLSICRYLINEMKINHREIGGE